MDTVKLSWSGGKDSTAAAILHLERGDLLKIVYYIPMLKDTIPLIRKDHYEFIECCANRFRKMGAEVYKAEGISYYDLTHKLHARGKRAGFPFGTSLGLGFCVFRDNSKLKALRGVDVGVYDYESIGIAFDEPKRQNQLTDKKRSILVEEKVTEENAKYICEANGMLSPHYQRAKRDGCAICPNAKPKEFCEWLNEWGGAVEAIEDIEQFCKKWTPDKNPYRGKRWWSDVIKEYDSQTTFFDIMEGAKQWALK